MKDFLVQSSFFGAVLSLMFFEIGMVCKKKFKLAVFNPLLISIILTIAFLVVFKIPYSTYYQGAKYLSYLLTPATVCLAIPLYEQIELLKKNYLAIIAGIISGIITTLCLVLFFAVLFKLSHEEYITLLPKSVTSAIGMSISEQLGGYASVTVVVIIITGVIGHMIAESVCRIFKITHPVAKGVAIGTSSHAIGTTKAMEIGAVEGAMSGLSIAVSGILTVFCAILFSYLY